jgi:rsbT co-antagonist protein RsbR
MPHDQQTTVALERELEDVRQQLQEANERCVRLEETLREKEELLTFVIKYNPNAIAVFDNNMNIMLVSDRFRQDYGVADQQIVGRNHYDVFPDIPRVWRDVHARCLAGAHEFSDNDAFMREDGSVIYVRWDCRPWYNAQGEIGGMTAFTEVTTERKQAKQELRLAQAALDQSADGMHWMGRDGIHTYVNDTVCRSLGYSQEELLQMRVADIDPNFPPEAWEPTWNRVKESGSLTFETLHTHKDGRSIPVEVTATYLEFDGQEYICAISRDITERKLAEERLQIFKTMADTAPDGFGMANADGTLTYANAAYRALTGYGDALIGMNFLDHFTEADRVLAREALRATAEEGDWQGVLNFQRQDASIIPVDTKGFVTRDEEGNIVAVMGLFRDLREQKQYEEQLRTFKMLVENALDGIAYATPDGILRYSNAAFAAMTGFGEQVFGSTITDYYEPDDAAFVIQTVIPTVIQEGNWEGVLRLRRPDGEHWMGQSSVVALRNDADELILFIATFRDVTKQIADEEERTALQQQVIDAQRAALRELSTPLIPLSDRVVLMPLIGAMDSQRTQQVMETLLDGVARHQSDLVILDVTGVAIVDTQVAQAFIQVAQAVKLLGAQVMLTGIQPQIAQTLVHLGIDLSNIQTRGSLQAGITAALTQH